MTSPRPFLAVTLGDPAGIGPWVALCSALHGPLRGRARILLVGDAWVLRRFYSRAGRVVSIDHPGQYQDKPGAVNVMQAPHPRIRSLRLGVPHKIAGEAAALAIRKAVDLALSKQVAAVVTGPVSKESMKMARLPFPGHTEMLAALGGARRVEMVMAAGPLRTVLLTRHLPLKDVPRVLTASDIAASLRLVDPWLKKFFHLQRRPRWALCGLNPHAGDNGLLGREEKTTVAPAARALRRAGLDVTGPLPADVAWAAHAQGNFDAVASLFHDQGMIPLKTLYPKSVVNITAGLPFIRTSPGHGTAFDLAQGPHPYAAADPTATFEAARLALDMAGVR